MSSPASDPLIGVVLGDYRIEGLLGVGAMGRVYRATRLRLGQQVALKLLEPYLAADESFQARFEREWRLAASMNHPNIVPIFDAGEVDGRLYLAMLPVEGGDLGQLIRAEGPLDARSALGLLAQVANALDAAHSRGLVHRDVKPGNILLARGQAAEGDDHAYLADFGLTKHAGSQSRLTRVGTFVGTYHYAAPEQFGAGEVGPPADIYALGCVLYECLTGRVPFETDSDAALMRAHLNDPLPSVRARRPDLPAELDLAIARATAKDPAQRHPSARAFIAQARAALQQKQGATTAVESVGLAPTLVRPANIGLTDQLPAGPGPGQLPPQQPPWSQPPQQPPPVWSQSPQQPPTGWGPGYGTPSRLAPDRRPMYAVAGAIGLVFLIGLLAFAVSGPRATPTPSAGGPTEAPPTQLASPPVATPTRTAVPTPSPNAWPLKDGAVATAAEIELMQHIPANLRLYGAEPLCAPISLAVYGDPRAQLRCTPADPDYADIRFVDYVLHAGPNELAGVYADLLSARDLERDTEKDCFEADTAEASYKYEGEDQDAGRLACGHLVEDGVPTLFFGWTDDQLLIYAETHVVAHDAGAHARAYEFWRIEAGPFR